MRTLLILSLLLVSAPRQAKKFSVNPEDLTHPLTVKELSRPDPFWVSITRRFSGEREEQMLRIAESVYPPREDVLQCLRPLRPGGQEPTAQYMWSCGGDKDEAQLPYAITKSAVASFIELSERLRRGEVQSRYSSRTSFSYIAEITHQESYRVGDADVRDVYLVRMSINWHQTCGDVPDLCSMTFSKWRKVVLGGDGSVLAVEGDGPPQVLVS